MGYRQCLAYAEVPFTAPSWYQGKCAVDFVGKGFDSYLIAVEMKKSLCWALSNQAWSLLSSVNRAYCAVYSNPLPKSLDMFTPRGIGVLRVVNGHVEVLAECAPREPTRGCFLEIEKGVLNGVAGLQTGGGA